MYEPAVSEVSSHVVFDVSVVEVVLQAALVWLALSVRVR
jgi:hypothetical protein